MPRSKATKALVAGQPVPQLAAKLKSPAPAEAAGKIPIPADADSPGPFPNARRGQDRTVVRHGLSAPGSPSTGPAVEMIVPRAAGERVFHSRGANYHLQMTSPAPETDAYGRRIWPPSRQIVFVNGEYRTSDSAVIQYIVTSDGYGRDYWDAVDRQSHELKDHLRQLARQLAASPEAAELLRQELGADFDVLSALAAKQDAKESEAVA